MAGVTGTRAVIAAVGVALVLGVAACSGSDPEPRIAPPSSSAPSSPSTSPAAGATSSDPDQRQAQADLLASFVAGLSTALSTGDASSFMDLAATNCQNCRVLAKNLEKAFEDGGHIEGGAWTISSSKYQREAPLGSIWNVDVHSARERWYDGSGDLVKIVREGTQHFGFALEASGNAWKVRELRLRQS